MAIEIPLKRSGGRISQYVVGDILANRLFGINPGSLHFGTSDGNDVIISVNSNERWRIAAATGNLRKGNSGAQTFGLSIFGTGNNSTITVGDLLADDIPYQFLRENGGIDTDQWEIYAQKGIFHKVGPFGAMLTAIAILQTNKIGFAGITTPTAKTHFAGSSSGANNAAIKIDPGTLASAADGQLEYNGTNLSFCVGTTRYTLSRALRVTSVLDFPSTSAGTTQTLTVNVPGAAINDHVNVAPPPGSITSPCFFWGYVSAADTVTVVHQNPGGVSVNPVSGTFGVEVTKYI